MPRQRVLSSEDILRIFKSFGFEVESQKGSHVKVRRVSFGARQTLIVPNHPELDKGTVKAIYNQAKRYITESELQKHFYNQ